MTEPTIDEVVRMVRRLTSDDVGVYLAHTADHVGGGWYTVFAEFKPMSRLSYSITFTVRKNGLSWRVHNPGETMS